MIIIDAGHGGTDYGGGSNRYWYEKDLTLAISLYQYNRFKELGIKVELTRSSDIDLYSTKRIEKVQSITPTGRNDLLISNHINIDYGTLDGAEVIYSITESDKLPKIIASNLAQVGQNLSINGVYTRTNENGNDYYYIIRQTKPYESIIVEYGFADSPEDDVNLLLYKWEDLAEAVVKSVCQYYNYTYDAQTSSLYIVKPGDSLYKIANIYNTTIDNLISLNNLKSNVIQIGQSLKVPLITTTDNVITYIVKSGDTVYKISKLFNVDVNTIKNANNKYNDTIYVGESLIIPLNKSIYKYTIKSGDSLYAIASKYGVSVEYIMGLNNLNSTLIKPGETLLI